MKFAHICERKGATEKWVIEKIIEDINRLGYTEVVPKGDGEPALQEVLQEVKRLRNHSTILQALPAYDPQSNGAAEKAVQEYMGQLRTMKIGLEARLQAQDRVRVVDSSVDVPIGTRAVKSVPSRT